MRKIIIAALTALCVGTTLTLGLPQTSFAAGKAGGKRLQKLSETLALTDAQKAQIKPIMMSTRKQAKAIKEDTTLTPEEQKAKIKALRLSMRSQIMPLLTSDQKAKLAAMKHNAKAGKAD
jgi:Spy/CpxP family protein refolding chaperone